MTDTIVTIERKKIDGKIIRGFVLKESKKLLMIQEVYNLGLDGILVINKKEITDRYVSKTNEYQTQMLKDLGIYQQIRFDVDYDIKNWRRFFESASTDFEYFEVDDEGSGVYIYYIGKLVKIKKKSIALHEFSGAGNWYEEPTKIYYDDISTCGIAMHYTETYAKYISNPPNK